MRFHPYCEIFPLLEGPAFDELVADIREHGLREDILTYGGLILDGRNRARACQVANIQPRFKPFVGSDEQALSWVVSANVHRRHLTDSQKAMAAARISNLRHGQRADQHPQEVPIGTSSKMTGASVRSTKRARKVIDKGSKRLQRAVDSGDVTVSRAAAVVELPKAEQLAAAQAPAVARAQADDPRLSDAWTPDEDEERALELAERDWKDRLDKIMASDDKLAEARTQIEHQAALIASLTISRDGFMEGKKAITKLLKSEQRRNARLIKELESLRKKAA